MTYVNNRISAIGYGNAGGLKWQTFQTDTNGTLLWSSPYIEPTPLTQSDSYPHYVLAKPTGEVIVTGVGGPTPDPFNPSFNQMPIVQYSNTGVQNWISTPNIYAGTGLATVLLVMEVYLQLVQEICMFFIIIQLHFQLMKLTFRIKQ